MAGTKNIKRQIVSVKNTQKVTKAMKMVSAAKMRRANEAMQATNPYAAKIKEVAVHLSGLSGDNEPHPYMIARKEVKNIALLLINSDRGLCGAFNSNVVRMATRFREEHPGKTLKLFIVGKNAYDYFKKQPHEIIEKWTSLGGKISYDTAKRISDSVTDSFMKEKYDELYLIYNEFRSVSVQYPKTEKIMPLSFEGSETQRDYLFEPKPAELLAQILPRYVTFSIYHKLLESAAGEHGARMVAMDNATRSADDMVKKLTLNYNKARQAAITKDLLDIVNGAEALK
ncbi:MAG: ATP synthase F1 subunit gamma [Deferribacteraceae bacterium]|jgi:F-type H+-transporting ATPase subunit gamma|nr:ATP synthase F1 subunit gamma [Deferribacteraceae bacterium]